jgi:hypothetical protein
MEHRRIPGTPIFDGEAAQKGYALNKMCFSLNSADNRAEFSAPRIAIQFRSPSVDIVCDHESFRRSRLRPRERDRRVLATRPRL